MMSSHTGEILLFSLAANKFTLVKRVDSLSKVPIVQIDVKDGVAVSRAWRGVTCGVT